MAFKGCKPWNKDIKMWANRTHPKGMLGKIAWNKGLTKETNTSLQMISEKLSIIRLGKKHSDESKKKMSISQKGKHFGPKSFSMRLKLSQSCLGRIIFPETRLKISKAMKGRILTNEWKQKISLSRKGYKQTDEAKKKMSIAKKGVASRFKGIPRTEEIKLKIAKKLKGRKLPKEVLKKILSKVCQRPNNFEKKCGEYLNKLFPNKFKYCGDGSIIINNHSPDYISDDQTIVVLCNGLYWHLLKFGLKDTIENKRIVELKESKPFVDVGYEVWFIWETR